MPHSVPPFVKPWTRNNWPTLNKGQKQQQWQEYLFNKGQPVPDLDEHVAEELNIEKTWIAKKVLNKFNALFSNENHLDNNINNDNEKTALPLVNLGNTVALADEGEKRRISRRLKSP
jgi:hypothetical protein